MLRIGRRPPPMAPDRLDRLAQVEVATLGHHLHEGFLDPAIRPLIPDARVAGTAVTLSIPGPDSSLLYRAMDEVGPGDVLMIDRAGDARHACWGGFMSAVARLRGIAGAVVDGPVTDPEAVRAAGVPVWARGVTALTTKLMGLGGRLHEPVSVGGVAVSPGDAVLADSCGVVVLPPEDVDRLAEIALAEQAEEDDWLERMRGGARLAELAGLHPLPED